MNIAACKNSNYKNSSNSNNCNIKSSSNCNNSSSDSNNTNSSNHDNLGHLMRSSVGLHRSRIREEEVGFRVGFRV